MFLLGAGLAPGGVGGPDSALVLRYDLRPGDRLVYHQVFEWELDGRAGDSASSTQRKGHRVIEAASRAEATNQLVVLGASDGALVIGVQRNRGGAKLLRYEEGGRDVLSRQRAEFEGMRPVLALAEANLYDPAGTPRLSRVVTREWPSKVLWNVSELEPLPSGAVRPGDVWSDTVRGGLSFQFRAAGWERLGNEDCLRVEGWASGDSLAPGATRQWGFTVRYWYCRGSGLIQRLEFEGDYPGFMLERITERLTLDLVERRRDEALGPWLQDSASRLAALAALGVAPGLDLTWAQLEPLLATGDTTTQRAALGLAYRRGLAPAAPDRLAPLLESPDPRVRSLAAQVLASLGERARPLLEKAAGDGDYFVRRAVKDWLRVSPRVAAESTSCRADTAALDRLLAARRFTPEPPGIRLHYLSAPGYAGWPFVVQVPEDYRSDRPVPLLVYLAGGAGSELDAMLLARWGLARTGYLVVYPDAAGWWWWWDRTGMVNALLDEVQREFNVDPQRIYLSGLSNGGTGTFYYAALWPQRFTAAVSAMGAGVMLPGTPGDGLPEPGNTANVPLLFLHGRADSTVAPIATETTMKQLGRRAAPAEAHYFKDLGHEVVLGRTDEGRTLQFFQRFEQRALPRTIAFTSRGVRFNRHYWVEIVERGDDLIGASSGAGTIAPEVASQLAAEQPASVAGSIEAGNTIRLATRNVKRLRLLLREDLLPGAGPARVILNGKVVFEGPVPFSCEAFQQSLRRSPDPLLAYSASIELSVGAAP
jgi:poly(3-hydroxybutyrate) depolymerase